MSVAADISVLLFTLLETRGIFRASNQINIQTSVTSILLKNGSVQFLVLLILNIVSMVLDLLSIAAVAGDNVTTFIYINEALGSILLSRFLLDLRSVFYTGDTHDELPDRVESTVHFATSIVGNMGATLNTWKSGDSSSYEDIQYSVQPFSVGLLEPERESWSVVP
ncbi:hypothetical protein QCA50_007794 [Cerrena zonata]|uniref:Uncharacterized protein n=1 Tax=Cerrena zonata TaxID=2478898 RepID=A0AAW0GGA3_9APHY